MWGPELIDGGKGPKGGGARKSLFPNDLWPRPHLEPIAAYPLVAIAEKRASAPSTCHCVT